jgi:sugar lactone lactonase YvrE
MPLRRLSHLALVARSAFAARATLVTLAALVGLAALVALAALVGPANLVPVATAEAGPAANAAANAAADAAANAAADAAADSVLGLGDNHAGDRGNRRNRGNRGPTADPAGQRLSIERFATESVVGPEDFAIEPSGDLVCGTADGRILRVRVTDGRSEELAQTGGYPLGLAFDRHGNLLIADAHRGLLSLDEHRGLQSPAQGREFPNLGEDPGLPTPAPGGEVRALVTEEGGAALHFTNGVAIGASGAVYFSDSSRRHGPEAVHREALDAQPSGRLLRYDPATGAVDRLLDGLFFANGVAVDPEERFVLVAETFAYRVTRYWLQGAQAGRSEAFVEDLPGLPDGISYNGAGVYWLALFAPRSRLLDALAHWPSVRRLLAWLPASLLPAPERHGRVLGLDIEGRVVHDLRDPAGTYAPISSARQVGPWLYLGSLTESGIGRAALPAPEKESN